MSENKVNTKESVIEQIKKLNELRANLENKKTEINVHERDLGAIETINGVDSNEWKVKNEILNSVKKDIETLESKIAELSFKKSELKSVLDDVAKEFEGELRKEQEKEYHIEIGTTDEETGKNNGKRVFKELLEYVQKDVLWTAKTAPGLMMLDRNMMENKPWVQSKDFDGVIILRSANVLVLYRSVLEEMQGKGAFEARKFLSCWANCGKAITDAVREIQTQHENTRNLGSILNEIESEFDRSIDDIPEGTDSVSTKEEVAPSID